MFSISNPIITIGSTRWSLYRSGKDCRIEAHQFDLVGNTLQKINWHVGNTTDACCLAHKILGTYDDASATNDLALIILRIT